MKFDQLQEIRLRAGRPLMLLYDNEERLIGDESGFVTEMSQAYRVSAQEIQETMTFISHYSIYAYEEEIRQGTGNVNAIGKVTGFTDCKSVEGCIKRTAEITAALCQCPVVFYM